MKNKILSILGSILLTTFIAGFFIFVATGNFIIVAYSGVIIMLVTFYFLIKYWLNDLEYWR